MRAGLNALITEKECNRNVLKKITRGEFDNRVVDNSKMKGRDIEFVWRSKLYVKHSGVFISLQTEQDGLSNRK